MLQAIVRKGIEMLDYECLVDERETRILGFGRFAGIVGAHNGLLRYGQKRALLARRLPTNATTMPLSRLFMLLCNCRLCALC
ncbi:MAG: hypothetical protein IPL33_06445 [Sphingobacteriales bacterium]|nr:hypothetical protein [Sphingobacteriales bacterium]